MNAPSPGLYPGTSDDEYFSWDAVNCSTLKTYKRSAAHARAEQLKPRESSALTVGSAIHVATLEPDSFDDRYVVGPEGRAGTIIYKAAEAELEKSHPNCIMLRPAEMVTCQATMKRIKSNALAMELLSGEGANEVAAIAMVRNVKFKFKMDRYTEFEGVPTIVDIKTTRDASPWAFGSDAAKFSYPMSAWAYLNGLNELSPGRRRFITIAVEKDAPGVSIYEYSLDALQAGEVQFDKLMKFHLDCERNQSWPGYPEFIQTAQVPEWYLNTQDSDLS